VGVGGIGTSALAGREPTHPRRPGCREVDDLLAVLVAPDEGLAVDAKSAPDGQHPLRRALIVMQQRMSLAQPSDAPGSGDAAALEFCEPRRGDMGQTVAPGRPGVVMQCG